MGRVASPGTGISRGDLRFALLRSPWTLLLGVGSRKRTNHEPFLHQLLFRGQHEEPRQSRTHAGTTGSGREPLSVLGVGGVGVLDAAALAVQFEPEPESCQAPSWQGPRKATRIARWGAGTSVQEMEVQSWPGPYRELADLCPSGHCVLYGPTLQLRMSSFGNAFVSFLINALGHNELKEIKDM